MQGTGSNHPVAASQRLRCSYKMNHHLKTICCKYIINSIISIYLVE